MNRTIDDESVRLNALIRLGLARQSKLDDESLDVYSDHLNDIDTDVLVAACSQLCEQERLDYDPAFPSVGAIRTACKDIPRQRELARLKALAATAPKKLLHGSFTTDRQGMSRDQAKEFTEHFKARVEAMRKKS